MAANGAIKLARDFRRFPPGLIHDRARAQSPFEVKCVDVVSRLYGQFARSQTRIMVDRDTENMFADIVQHFAGNDGEFEDKKAIVQAYLDFCVHREDLTLALVHSLLKDLDPRG